MKHGRKRKIAFLQDFSDYTTGRIRALRTLGHEVIDIHVAEKEDVPRALGLLKIFQPDYIFAHDYTMFEAGNAEARKWSREYESQVTALQIPMVFCFLDAPERAGWPRFIDRLYRGELNKEALYFAPSEKNAQQLRDLGYHAKRARGGINPKYFDLKISNETRRHFAADVSFVGSPNFESSWLDLPAEHSIDFSPLSISDIYSQIAIHWFRIDAENWMKDEATSFPEWESTLKQIERDYLDFFQKSIDTSEAYLIARDDFFKQAFEKYPENVARLIRGSWNSLYNYYSSAQLVIRMKSLRENFNLGVWGGEVWRLFLGLERPSPVIPKSDCFAVAASSGVFYCQNKHQLHGSLHERVLIAYAAGGFPITDHHEELFDYFDPSEIVTYASPEEAYDKIKYYLKNEDERQKISERARTKVMDHFTYETEAKMLIDAANKHFQN